MSIGIIYAQSVTKDMAWPRAQSSGSVAVPESGSGFRERKLEHCQSDYIQIKYFSSVNSLVFFLVLNMYKYLYLHNTH